jgi:hypothetical protein
MKIYTCAAAGLCAFVLAWGNLANAADRASVPGQFSVTDVQPQESSPFKAEQNSDSPSDSGEKSSADPAVKLTTPACDTCGKACGCEGCGDCCCCGPAWTFDADAVFFTRSRARERALVLNPAANVDNVLLTGHDLSFSDYEAGPRLSATRRLQSGWDLEVTYFQIDGWRSSDYFANLNNVMVGDNQAVESLDTSVVYGSALYSGEFLVHRQLNCWLNVSAGFRIMELDDKLTTSGTDPNMLENIFTSTRAYNHLYGLQLGADVSLFNHGDRFTLDGIAKVGAYNNRITQSSTIFVDQSLTNGVNDSADHTALVGEFGIMAKYRITCHLAARAGYEVLFLDGVGLAPEQVDKNDFANNTAGVNTHGHVLYQGATLGLEATW